MTSSAPQSSLTIRPRRAGVLALRADGSFDPVASDSIRMNKGAEIGLIEGKVVGFKPYAGMKIETPVMYPNHFVIAKLELYKEEHPQWLVYEPQQFVRGLEFRPKRDYLFKSLRQLLGKWRLTVHVALVDRRRIPEEQPADFYDQLSFTLVQTTGWEFYTLRELIEESGDLKEKIPEKLKEVRVDFTDI